ncbi:MAG: hypothetical protein IJD95_05020 [Clostridia bacterium]|nr:hypothetical protein [Clostridia bacterium]
MNTGNKKGAAVAVTVISLILWTALPVYVGILFFVLKNFDLGKLLIAMIATLLAILFFSVGSFFAPVFLATMQKSRKTEWVYIIATLLNVITVVFWAFYLSSLHINENATGGMFGSPEFWAELGSGLITLLFGGLLMLSVWYLLISLVQLLVYRGIYGYEFKLQRKPCTLSIIVFSALSAASLAGSVIRFITVLPEKPTVNEALATFAAAGAILITVISITVWFFINKKPLAVSLAIISPIQTIAIGLSIFAKMNHDGFYMVAFTVLPILAVLLSYLVSAAFKKKKV